MSHVAVCACGRTCHRGRSFLVQRALLAPGESQQYSCFRCTCPHCSPDGRAPSPDECAERRLARGEPFEKAVLRGVFDSPEAEIAADKARCPECEMFNCICDLIAQRRVTPIRVVLGECNGLSAGEIALAFNRPIPWGISNTKKYRIIAEEVVE